MNRKPAYSEDNRGSALILILVAVAFLGILGAAVLSATSMNVQMKSMDQAAKKNFYHTDSYIEEIASGLSTTISKAAGIARESVLKTYTQLVADKSISAEQIFAQKFLENIVPLISGAAGDTDYEAGHYKRSLILSYLSDGTVLNISAGDNIMILDSANQCVVLKNIAVSYKEPDADYKTDIKTDIVIEIPGYAARTDGIYPEYTKYTLIADTKLVFEGNSSHIVGDIYAGAGGIEMNNSAVDIVADSIITRGDLLFKPLIDTARMEIKANFGNKTNLWAENIKTTGGGKLTIIGNCYISDDLELSGKSDDVKITGNYYGYNYNKNNEKKSGLLTEDSKYSSAVMVNGGNANLSIGGSLILAGRSFISRATDVGGISYKDILMGESLSVRGNQIAYYVPSAYIDASKGTLLVSKYEDYIGIKGITKWVDSVVPYYVRGLDNPYWYLTFKNDFGANEFFKAYYSKYPESMEQYAKNVKISFNKGTIDYSVAGNLFIRENGTMIRLDSNIITGEDGPTEALLADAKAKAYEYASRQLSLLPFSFLANSKEPRLLDIAESTTYNKESHSVFEAIINKDTIEKEILSGSFKVFENKPDFKVGYKVIIVNGDYTVNSPISGILAATGDVVVKSNFNGVILSGGVINVTDTGAIVNQQPMSSDIQTMLELDRANEYAQYFKGLPDQAGDSTAKSPEEYMEFSDSIRFENWTKNKE